MRRLLAEFRFRENAFKPAFPQFKTPQADYATWEIRAIEGVQLMLEIEIEQSQRGDGQARIRGRS